MKVLSVVGARPQFIKAAVVSAEFARRGIDEVLVHTGQHHEHAMSGVFFDELGVPAPRYNLGVAGGGHGAQTGEMLKRLDPVLVDEQPDWVLVYGDTNSTLAAALAAAKLHFPIAHVEAGLRSHNRAMPEEINRIVADHVADLLLVPTETAAAQLAREGLSGAVRVVGDVMVDLAARVAAGFPERPAVLERFGLTPKAYGVATIHRASNTDDETVFSRLVAGLRAAGMPVVFPVHPRTRALVQRLGVGEKDGIYCCDPLPYAEMLALVARARVLLTDSGGLQKEAFVVRTPCVTLRDETEWVETLEDGWNVLAGSDPDRIAAGARRAVPVKQGRPYGDGHAAAQIADALLGDRQTCAA